MNIALIGQGAIARFVMDQQAARGFGVSTMLLRPGRQANCAVVHSVADLPGDLDIVVDCAGHEALGMFGPDILRSGRDLITVSLGALADGTLYDDLQASAISGNATLHLASGAIGALDALQSANIGTLEQVRYIGRKPPQGWIGSPAEDTLDLANPGREPQTHFAGTAREAALRYPKNANVAAAVALAGVGFDATQVLLISDPGATANIHEIHARGSFGSFEFRINGTTLPGNPRTSALAAMSVVSTITKLMAPIRL